MVVLLLQAETAAPTISTKKNFFTVTPNMDVRFYAVLQGWPWPELRTAPLVDAPAC
jgi:hypothetical protein